ncbi:translocation/assembly module TamB domain-containing protein [Mangrovimonas aestuarii]|uniref:translocation/assembly module TamB domain-containing protein n=1 Tax=Mangrovimonas aestuarii TaxID=3018443 RepID=UPI0023783F61|nr:translocation/assembly module TamB [Mangrovimonas aestuarii]
MAILLLLFIILVLVFSIPAIQTRLGHYFTNKLNKKYQTNINVGRVGLQYNGDVELKDVYIEDYKKDTLISVKELNTSILNFRNLANSKLAFGDIDLYGVYFHIKTYKGETETNLDKFVASFDDDKRRSETNNFLMSSSDVSIYNGRFLMTDENKEKPNILNFKKLNINATNFLINGSNVDMRVNTLSFEGRQGLQMENLTTNFSYTISGMTFDNLNIKTGNSRLKGSLQFIYDRENLRYFTDKVQLKAKFTEADVALDEVNRFYSEFGEKQRAKFTGEFYGTLNNLEVKNLRLDTSRRSKIYGDVEFKNLFDNAKENFSMQGRFDNLTSNYNDLREIMPNLLGKSIPSTFEKFGDFTINGVTNITPTSIDADIEIETEIGFVKSDLVMTKINDIDNASYQGNLVFDSFGLGVLLDNPKFGDTSFDLDVKGKGFKAENINTKIHGDVFLLQFNNYTYRDIDVAGILRNNVYEGKLFCNDENLKLDFDGLADFSDGLYAFDFVANVTHSDLKALNFVKNDSLALFKGRVDMKMSGSSPEDAEGSLAFKDTHYQNEHDDYYFQDFAITSTFQDSLRYVSVNSPDIIEGDMTGKFKFKDLGKLFQNALGSYYRNYTPIEVERNQFADFNFKIYNKIIEVFYPNIELGKNTYIKGRVESDEKGFQLTFNSPEIRFFEYFVSKINVQMDNKNPLFNSMVEIDSINTKYYKASKFNLVNVTLKDTLYMRTEFRGGKGNRDAFNLNFYHTINQENQSVVGIKPSDITFKENTWYINRDDDMFNRLTFSKSLSEFEIEDIVMTHDNEEMRLSGVLLDSTSKDLTLNFKNVNLDHVTPELDSIKLGGRINGKLNVLQKKGIYLPSSTITIDSFEVNDFILGDFNANIEGNENLTEYTIEASIKDDFSQSFKAVGGINIGQTKPVIDLNLALSKFNLSPLSPLGKDVMTNIRGLATGNVKVTGALDHPSYDGALQLENAGLTINYLNVDYGLSKGAMVRLVGQSFQFKQIGITDTVHNTKGLLEGSITHNNFSEWELNLGITTPRLLVLNTEETEDSLYYGTGFMGGEATIVGPTDQLVISVEAETKEGTVFKIPLNDTESIGDNTFVHFLSPEEKKAKAEGKEVGYTDIGGLELDFELDVNQNAEIELIMDKNSGSTIRGRGVGGLLIEINTNGKFNIYGDFSVFEGVYNFLFGGIIQKQFIVEPGGTLAWDGNPFSAQININAIYKTQANPSPLLDNPINKSIPVNVEIHLTDRLEKPELDFQFSFPTVNSTVNSELQYRLESAEERSNQALFLLSTGGFSSGINNITPYGNMTERLSGIVNNLLSGGANSLLTDGDNKVNIGLNYKVGQNTPEYQTGDELGLTLQTQINDRILINGNVGVPIGGVSETVIAGDIEIQFLVNEDGTLRLKMFNRENSIQNFGEEIGYTQGLGISYSVDFDTFNELVNKLFKGKVKMSKSNEIDQNEKIQDSISNPLPDFIDLESDSPVKSSSD